MRYILLLLMLVSAAVGDTVGTFTFTGTANGMIGSTSFTNTALTVTAPGDFSTVSCASGHCLLSVAAEAASFNIGGVGSGTFSDATYFFDNQVSIINGTPPGLVGFGDGSDDIQLYGALIGTSVFATYNLQSAIGPLGPQAADLSVGDWHDLSTSGGAFTVDSLTNFSFQVSTATPEPSSVILIGIGLGFGIWSVQSRSRQKKPISELTTLPGWKV